MLCGGAVPLKPGLSQEDSIFWRLWMNFWLQGNALPVVWIFLDLFWKLWCLKIHVLSPSLPWAVGWERKEDFRVVSAGRCEMLPGALGLFCRACDMGMVSLMPPPSLDLCHIYPRCCNVHLKIFVNLTSCKALLIERNPKSLQKPLKWAVILGEFLISEFWLYWKIGTATENSTI